MIIHGLFHVTFKKQKKEAHEKFLSISVTTAFLFYFSPARSNFFSLACTE
jgi:hypothetical protein